MLVVMALVQLPAVLGILASQEKETAAGYEFGKLSAK